LVEAACPLLAAVQGHRYNQGWAGVVLQVFVQLADGEGQ
jgi:hypothetical protein